MPAFNNENGNATIRFAGNKALDSFNYDVDLHYALLDETEGVSFEKLVLDKDNNLKSNWNSAAESVNFASPGYKNSNFISLDNKEEISLSSKGFNPYNNEIVLINFNLKESGYLANIRVYDAEGHQIKALSNNELLGSSSIVKWDGTNEDDQLERAGIYIIAGELFNTNLATRKFKLVCALKTNTN